MPKIKIFDGMRHIPLDAENAETVGGKRVEDLVLISHVGSGGEEHAQATTTEAGFLGPIDKEKLDRIFIGEGVGGSVAILNANGRVDDSEKVAGKNLFDLDDRYKPRAEESLYIVYQLGQKEIPIGVTNYEPSKDRLEVFQDGFRLTRDINYILNPTKLTIDLKEYIAEWGSEFLFVVHKGIKTN